MTFTLTTCMLALTLCFLTTYADPGERLKALSSVWEQYKHKHRLNLTATESTRRLTIWQQNLDRISLHNLEAKFGKHTYQLDINQFAHFMPSEYQQLLGYRSRRQPPYPPPQPVPVKPTPPPTAAPVLPASTQTQVDWKAKGWVTPVMNQGLCGSCWAFSACGALEGQLFNKTSVLTALSEQNLMDCTLSYGNNGCNGGAFQNAFNYVKANGGLDTNAEYPYTGKLGSCQYKPSSVPVKITSWKQLPAGDETSLQNAVTFVGPIAIAVDASPLTFQMYKSGVYQSTECQSANINHGMLLTGYGVYQDASGQKQPYWMLKNSWGTDWGMQGYMMLARNSNNMCGIASNGAYPLM